jgi:cold shock CspA family protein
VTESVHGVRRRGTVVSFDESVGLGTIVDPVGTEFLFHCIEIADGSRSIAVGSEVDFELLAKLGRWEAGHIRP